MPFSHIYELGRLGFVVAAFLGIGSLGLGLCCRPSLADNGTETFSFGFERPYPGNSRDKKNMEDLIDQLNNRLESLGSYFELLQVGRFNPRSDRQYRLGLISIKFSSSWVADFDACFLAPGMSEAVPIKGKYEVTQKNSKTDLYNNKDIAPLQISFVAEGLFHELVEKSVLHYQHGIYRPMSLKSMEPVDPNLFEEGSLRWKAIVDTSEFPYFEKDGRLKYQLLVLKSQEIRGGRSKVKSTYCDAMKKADQPTERAEVQADEVEFYVNHDFGSVCKSKSCEVYFKRTHKPSEKEQRVYPFVEKAFNSDRFEDLYLGLAFYPLDTSREIAGNESSMISK